DKSLDVEGSPCDHSQMGKDRQSNYADHVSRLIEMRRKETPDVPLDGMEVFGRARRLTLLSRGPIEAVFAKHGVDTGEFDVLATLQRTGAPYALRPTELYQTLMISSGGLTDRLRRLEERGLITRESSETDQRSVMVKLSAKGKALIYKAYAEDMAVEFDLLSPLSKSERADLARLLSKLLLGLEETHVPK
ncbi:MAG: MarR family transcriptional regulator, partial [Sphingorhabdus sp.]|uniref:MarR family winged helix-turn-helix transcriptional regulator n=1 Tax=Sphingorhabdus sp. TaxID=1902408 RepID=UPI003C9E3D09